MLREQPIDKNSLALYGGDKWNSLHNDVKLPSAIQSLKAKYKAHTNCFSMRPATKSKNRVIFTMNRYTITLRIYNDDI